MEKLRTPTRWRLYIGADYRIRRLCHIAIPGDFESSKRSRARGASPHLVAWWVCNLKGFQNLVPLCTARSRLAILNSRRHF